MLNGNGKITGPHKVWGPPPFAPSRALCQLMRPSHLLAQVSYGLPGRVDVGGEVTAKNIIIATGSVPFVPPGITVDGEPAALSHSRYSSPCGATRKLRCRQHIIIIFVRESLARRHPEACLHQPPPGKTVFTSDHALKLDWIPDWVGIIGSGCVPLRYSFRLVFPRNGIASNLALRRPPLR